MIVNVKYELTDKTDRTNKNVKQRHNSPKTNENHLIF